MAEGSGEPHCPQHAASRPSHRSSDDGNDDDDDDPNNGQHNHFFLWKQKPNETKKLIKSGEHKLMRTEKIQMKPGNNKSGIWGKIAGYAYSNYR